MPKNTKKKSNRDEISIYKINLYSNALNKILEIEIMIINQGLLCKFCSSWRQAN